MYKKMVPLLLSFLLLFSLTACFGNDNKGSSLPSGQTSSSSDFLENNSDTSDSAHSPDASDNSIPDKDPSDSEDLSSKEDGSEDQSVGVVTERDSQESLSASIPTAQQTSGIEKLDLSQLSGLTNELICWGPGVERDGNGQIVGAVKAQERYGKYDALFIGGNQKKIILTFDEGYENGYTAGILDTLKAKKVSAVFFITGDYLERESALIQRMIDEGHIIGNHSVNHKSLPSITVEEAAEEILNLHQQVEEQFHYTMTLFRPPKGEYSEKTLMLAKTLGYQNIFWSFAYKDWEVDNQMGVTAAFDKVCKGLHPGAIYLLHAVSSDNAALLGDWIDYVRAQGYEFVLPSEAVASVGEGSSR